MLQKRISMLGAFAVGKTSLVERFVKGNYTAKYQTTVGVKINWRVVKPAEQELKLIIWDLAGEDEFQKVKVSNLKGSHGYLVVADGTRGETLEIARELQQRALETIGPVPFVLLLNKIDLTEQWDLDEASLQQMINDGWDIFRTSAKTGTGVEEAFTRIAALISSH
jgi:small GTP-binding protein